jgi:hypothetical protein
MAYFYRSEAIPDLSSLIIEFQVKNQEQHPLNIPLKCDRGRICEMMSATLCGTATRTTTTPITTDELTTTTDTPVVLITTMVVAMTTANAITTTSHATITARKRRN